MDEVLVEPRLAGSGLVRRGGSAETVHRDLRRSTTIWTPSGKIEYPRPSLALAICHIRVARQNAQSDFGLACITFQVYRPVTQTLENERNEERPLDSISCSTKTTLLIFPALPPRHDTDIIISLKLTSPFNG
jgi:hypothetical protein